MAQKRQTPPTDDGGVDLVRRVFDGLSREIATGLLRPGEPLSRRQIATRYGVSYTPVVEALVRLEQTGLIEADAGQIARVRRLSLESIHSDYVLREAIEVQAIRLACAAATPAEIEELSKMAAAVDAQLDASWRGRAPKGPELDTAFHRRIAELSRYAVLVRELDQLALAEHFRRSWITPRVPDDPPRQHAPLVAAIAGRDPAAADAEMRAHVHSGLRDAVQAFHLGTIK